MRIRVASDASVLRTDPSPAFKSSRKSRHPRIEESIRLLKELGWEDLLESSAEVGNVDWGRARPVRRESEGVTEAAFAYLKLSKSTKSR
ncbi:hypothetical protein NDU88_004239 [Pleurodeles waltl]|uniref:Uncharacterized protein n=1 Tax=Pleurodeles waltl TaxID=8319 RepID=A0AAV7UIJ8_PLEWA|nr:hypothetical protein NDU88_004239 [Pleurodeles waltl]